MRILITNTFKRAAKKLHRNQVTILEEVIKELSADPEIGSLKLGDLTGIRVYKFHLQHQLTLLAYIYNELRKEITLLSLSPHGNFYKNLKN